jgi:lysozyme family protein
MINMGTGTAAKNLQKALGIRINADGKFGPLTLAALNSTPPAEVEKKWKQRLINYYTQIAPRVGPQYLKGWLARVEDLFGPAGT